MRVFLRAGNPPRRVHGGFLQGLCLLKSTSLTGHMLNTFHNAANITYFQLRFETNLFLKIFLKKSTNPQCILQEIKIERRHLVAVALPQKRKVMCRITSCFIRAQNGQSQSVKLFLQKRTQTKIKQSCLHNAHPRTKQSRKLSFNFTLVQNCLNCS